MHDLIQSIRNVVREEIDAALSRHFIPGTLDTTAEHIDDAVEHQSFTEGKVTSPSLFTEISHLLQRFAMTPNYLGYKYLRAAINEAYHDPTAINRITTQLYPEIAEQFDTTPSRVERAIRHAIDVSWRKSDYVREFFPSGRRPVNSEFIATITEHLRLKKGAI